MIRFLRSHPDRLFVEAEFVDGNSYMVSVDGAVKLSLRAADQETIDPVEAVVCLWKDGNRELAARRMFQIPLADALAVACALPPLDAHVLIERVREKGGL